MMKKFLLLTIALMCCFTQVSLATETTTPKDKVLHQSEEAESDAKLKGFVIRHQINNAKITQGTQIKADPLALLHTLKADIETYATKEKPLNLKTTVTPLFSARLDKELKDAPSLLLETFIDNEGQGKTEFDIRKYQHTVPEDKNGGEVAINWKGLEGHFTYPQSFGKTKVDVTLKGLTITEKEAFSMELGRLAFTADLDKDLLPTRINTTLPILKFTDDTSSLTLMDLALETKMQKTPSQVEISNGVFNVDNAHFSATKQNKAVLKQLELTFGGKEHNKTVDFTSQLSIGSLTLPAVMTGENLKLSHSMDAAFNNVDAPAAAKLQQTVRDLQNQLHNGQISEDILNFAIFGQIMQLAPAFLAKSPEFALSNIALKTNQGNLQGDLALGVNGQKAKSLTNMMELLLAMTMQADFKIDKPLLKLALTALLGDQKQASTRIKALLKDKTIVETENKYILSATVIDNKLTLNGQEIGAPMDLFMLLMPLAMK